MRNNYVCGLPTSVPLEPPNRRQNRWFGIAFIPIYLKRTHIRFGNLGNPSTFYMYNKNKSQLAPVVNGCSSKQSLDNSFQDSFQKNCSANNSVKVEKLNERFSHAYEEYGTKHTTSCNCNSFRITLSNTIDALAAMKAIFRPNIYIMLH